MNFDQILKLGNVSLTLLIFGNDLFNKWKYPTNVGLKIN